MEAEDEESCNVQEDAMDQTEEVVEEELAPKCDSFDLQTEEIEMPRVVVITQNNDEGENRSKRVFLEPVTQDGQTYVLTLRENQQQIQNARVQYESAKIQTNMNDSVVEEGDFNQAWFTSREDKSNLHRKGQLWKQGMWSKEETDILQSNISHYCKERGVVDPAEIIFEMTKDERKDFYRTIAKGLNRPLFSVYRRVIRMYDNKNHVGKYTPEEIEKLRELRTKHGNDWQAIGSALGRSASSIKDRCRLMKDNCNTGKWLPVEERRLADAVYQQSRTVPGEMVTSGISWAAVADAVGTRSEKQCRTKWLNYLNWKQVGGTEWTREDDINLICKVYSLNTNDENVIDWVELSKGWPSVRSPQWLRGKWWNLKRHVPDAHLLSFRHVCEYLYNNHAQILHVKVSDETTSCTPVLETVVSSTAISIPQVSVVQTPSIVTTLPIQVKAEVPAVTTQSQGEEELCNPQIGATFQAYEVLAPPQPATPFIIATPTQAIPFTTCTSHTGGQIIIQALPAESIHSANVNENITVHMPSQLIISTAGTLSHGLATPIQITRPIGQLVTSQTGTLLATGSDAISNENCVNKIQHIIDGSEKQEKSEESTEISGETNSHLILSDPMLSCHNNPEFNINTPDQECEKVTTDN